MNTPSPFMVAREASNNLSNSFNRVRDENAIERILSESINSGDPQVLQNNIGKILSQVSPERHGAAISYLENAYSNIQKRQQQERLAGAEREAGVTPGLPPAVQAQQLKNKVPPKPIGGLTGQAVPQEISESIPKILEATKEANADQLAIALDKAGIPRAYSNSYIESRRRQDEAKAKAAQSHFEPESEKLEAKRSAELANEIENEYKAASNEDLRLDRMAVIDKEGNVSAPALVKTLDFLGLPIGILSNPATEEYRKLETDFVRDVSKVFPGGKITNYEVQSYLRTIPTLMNSPEGRKAIIRNRKLLNEAKIVRYDEYKKILKENNGKKPQNFGILLEERTAEKTANIEERFKEGIEEQIEKFQLPIRMIDPQGNMVNIPPNQIERALKAGAKFQ